MKEIPCVSPELLRSSPVYPFIIDQVKQYKKKIIVSSILNAIIIPLFVFFFGGFLVAFYFMGTSLIESIRAVIEAILSPILSDAVAFIVSAIGYYFLNGLILAPFVILIIGFLNGVYYSFKSIIVRYPNIADSLFIFNDLSESKEIMNQNLFSLILNKVFIDNYNRFVGFFSKDLMYERLMTNIYEKGGVIAKTPTLILPFAIKVPDFFRQQTSKMKLKKINMLDLGDHVIILISSDADIKDRISHADIIAIFEKKYKDILVQRLGSYDAIILELTQDQMLGSHMLKGKG